MRIHTRPSLLQNLLAIVIALAPALVRAEPGLLVIDVWGVDIDNRDERIPQSGWPARSYNLFNMETHKLSTNFFPNSGPWAVELDEGIYCLEGIKMFDNLQIDYCGEPYFKVIGGRVNNAGRWFFGVSRDLKRYRLVGSVQDIDQTLSRAQRFNEKLFSRYAPTSASGAASDPR